MRADGSKTAQSKICPKPYEQMQYPGQRVQIDVKFVPKVCMVGQEKGTQWYQYTFLDEYSRFRYLEAFEEHNTYTSAVFLRHVVEKFPYAIECIQTDNGAEFTKRLLPKGNDTPTLFENTLKELGIRHKLIRPYTPRHNGKVERSHRKDNEEFYASHRLYSLKILKSNWPYGKESITISLCVLLTGSLQNRFYLLSLICNTSLTNLQVRRVLLLWPLRLLDVFLFL